ncbi:MAG: choice-of-anchor D domain-containing protein, partial [Verrucomicrobia bacterium]|nr:choice-of-anchor D domain-containing protein [Verrucomicrobiota bacterium]
DGTNAADFTVGSLGAATLAPNTSTTFTVTFAPGAAGSRTAALHLASNDADENPFDISLTGTGVAVPEIAVEQPAGTNLSAGSASIDCGRVILGSTSGAFTITVKNIGTADLTGLAVSKDGTNAADFTLGSLGATTLAPNTSTTFSVTFEPGAAGSRTAALHLASNDADENPFDISLTGTGITAFQGWMTAAGVPPDQAGPEQMPQGDGIPNLLKFAFNMDPTKPDVRVLTVGADGTAGLPGGAVVGGVFRIEFLRRKALTNPGITYQTEFSSNLVSWVDLTLFAVATSIDETWERVVVDDPYSWVSKRFGRMKVVLVP